MADAAKIFGVDDSVFVFYEDDLTLTPQPRTVKRINILEADNEALIDFTDGKSVQDGTTQRVFETQALCATAIINDMIAKTAATVVLEGGADTTLVRTT